VAGPVTGAGQVRLPAVVAGPLRGAVQARLPVVAGPVTGAG